MSHPVKHIIFFFSLVLHVLYNDSALAQEDLVLKKMITNYEDTLIQLRNIVLTTNNEKERIAVNQKFLSLLENLLKSSNSFFYSFDSIPYIAIIKSPDKIFRIFNWNIPYDDGTQQYFGIIQLHDKKRDIFSIYTLADKSNDVFAPQSKILEHTEWFGALYYDIIPIKSKKQFYYTLLGWDGNDVLTNKKIIDVLYFDEVGVPMFGAEIFDLEQKHRTRIIFEYSAKVVMSMQYDAKNERIVFDHLSPEKPELEGYYSYYGPDFSYDAFHLKKGKWVYKKDIDAKGTDSNKYNNPK